MMFARRWLFHSRSSLRYLKIIDPTAAGYIPSLPNFPLEILFPPKMISLLSAFLFSVESRRAMANGESALNHPEISSGEKSPDF